MYTKLSLHLIKTWERTSKKERRDGEIGDHKQWNGSIAYEIEEVKQTRWK